MFIRFFIIVQLHYLIKALQSSMTLYELVCPELNFGLCVVSIKCSNPFFMTGFPTTGEKCFLCPCCRIDNIFCVLRTLSLFNPALGMMSAFPWLSGRRVIDQFNLINMHIIRYRIKKTININNRKWIILPPKRETIYIYLKPQFTILPLN